LIAIVLVIEFFPVGAISKDRIEFQEGDSYVND